MGFKLTLTGKTTLLNHIFASIESQNKIFLDLENPINRKYFEEKNYERIKKSFEFMGIDFETRAYFFLDEIQFVKNLPSIAKYLIDHYRVKFFFGFCKFLYEEPVYKITCRPQIYF